MTSFPVVVKNNPQRTSLWQKMTSVTSPAPLSLLAVMEVTVPEQPVVALHGMDATLNCSFSSNAHFNLSDLTVFWQLTDTKRGVHGYTEGREQLVDQAEAFANRTSLFPSQLGLGNASLLLKEVRVVDEGSYTCFVRVQDYGSAALLLQVAGESTSHIFSLLSGSRFVVSLRITS